MPNLLPPRPGGTLTAIAACPEADVIFVAHSGLDDIVSFGDVWRDFPIDQVVKARWWRVPHDAVPRTAGARVGQRVPEESCVAELVLGGSAGPAALVRPGSHTPDATWVDMTAVRTSIMVRVRATGRARVLQEASR